MKIKFLSDLHLEFGALEKDPDVADVLVLAGDVTTQNQVDWINKQADRFEFVVYVLGNHEHYKQYIEGTLAKTRAALASNVLLLENESVTLKGKRFHGCTLWTDFDKHNVLTLDAADRRSPYDTGLNDFRYIRFKEGQYRWTPESAYRTHLASRKFLSDNVRPGDVVVTHHAPSYLSIGEHFYKDQLRGAYASDLTDLIFDNEPVVWFHGHVHDNSDYTVGPTRVLCNPRGYVGHRLNPGFDLNAEVEL